MWKLRLLHKLQGWPSVRVFYSSFLKQQLKSVRHISTQRDPSFLQNTAMTQSTSIPNKATCDICCSTKCSVSPQLGCRLPSSEYIIVKYWLTQSQKFPVESKQSQKPNSPQIKNVMQKSYAHRHKKIIKYSFCTVEDFDEKKEINSS